jgi:RNA polymerase sigma-70 factor (ECF subfamily)
LGTDNPRCGLLIFSLRGFQDPADCQKLLNSPQSSDDSDHVFHGQFSITVPVNVTANREGNMTRAGGNDGLQIISSAKEGNEQVFADLFNQHKRTVYSLCMHMSNDVTEAEDLTQHAFISAYRRLHGCKIKIGFSAWLHRIAVSAAVTNLRKAKPDALLIDKSIRLNSSFQQQGSDPRNHQALDVIDRITLLQAIEKLPPVCRAVFVLHDVEGHQHHEIASLLECSIDSSRAQLHKARISIRNSVFQARNMQDVNFVGQSSRLRLRTLKIS